MRTLCAAVLGALGLAHAACVVGVGSEGSSDRETPASDDETDTGSGDSQSAVSPTAYLQRIAGIHCEQAFGCRDTYPEPTTFQTTWGASVPQCTTNLVRAWDPAAIETEIAKGRITFDGTAALACLAGVAFSACTEHWDLGIQWAESCYHVLVGTGPIGDACTTGYACVSGACDATSRRCM